MKLATSILVLLFTAVHGQQFAEVKPEKHPALSVQTCTKSGGCQMQQKSVVLDANWRWVHTVKGYQNCYSGTNWDKTLCPDGKTCAMNCALDGADYEGIYGIKASGSDLTLDFVTNNNVGSRVYLLDSEEKYMIFKLKNREFTFNVDVSKLPCGLNGALYFVEMDADGGMSRFEGNKAGAKYGTGYCDAQCPHDIKFINGEANVEEWDSQKAMGKYGTCCTEMDIWEANSISTAVTPHTCTVDEQTRCEGQMCGDPDRYGGACDRDGCDFNPFRLGDKTFFGPSQNMSINTQQPFTVVTQFITTDGTDNGDLKEIRRVWVQNGKVIQTRGVRLGNQTYDSTTDDFCNAQKKEFGDQNDYEKKGGNKRMGDILDKGMVLVMSLWDDHAVYMLWLDSNFPADQPPTKPGVARGTCPTSSGRPNDVEHQHPDANVKFFNIKFGEINSTYYHMN